MTLRYVEQSIKYRSIAVARLRERGIPMSGMAARLADEPATNVERAGTIVPIAWITIGRVNVFLESGGHATEFYPRLALRNGGRAIFLGVMRARERHRIDLGKKAPRAWRF